MKRIFKSFVNWILIYKRMAFVLTIMLIGLAIFAVSKNPTSILPAFALLFLWQFILATPKSIWRS